MCDYNIFLFDKLAPILIFFSSFWVSFSRILTPHYSCLTFAGGTSAHFFLFFFLVHNNETPRQSLLLHWATFFHTLNEQQQACLVYDLERAALLVRHFFRFAAASFFIFFIERRHLILSCLSLPPSPSVLYPFGPIVQYLFFFFLFFCILQACQDRKKAYISSILRGHLKIVQSFPVLNIRLSKQSFNTISFLSILCDCDIPFFCYSVEIESVVIIYWRHHQGGHSFFNCHLNRVSC